AAAAPAAPIVIAPLPNTRRLAEAPAFVLGASSSPSSSAAYGLTVRNTESKRKLDPQDDAAREQPPPPGPSGEDLMLRRFKEDMAVLPEIQGTDEYDEVPVEGFGAALLAGYGWKEGDFIGKKYKGMGDVKVREHGRRRCGTQGLGS
uniref:G-patch domain-containing protein n=2 Tax=Aegilops tauschii subsp. strangulata TaxID=200361 RepID=A0A453IPW8_AEGTS